jgi:hypothetical protein
MHAFHSSVSLKIKQAAASAADANLLQKFQNSALCYPYFKNHKN